jgi:hypothetical protein
MSKHAYEDMEKTIDVLRIRTALLQRVRIGSPRWLRKPKSHDAVLNRTVPIVRWDNALGQFCRIEKREGGGTRRRYPTEWQAGVK